MPDWTRLTDEPFFSEDGFIITVLGNEAELIAMGDGLRNGLGKVGGQIGAQMRTDYMELAAKGTFQVIQVNAPTGELVGTARLYVADAKTEPKVGIRFLRGKNNANIGGDNAASSAVGEFLEALKWGDIESEFNGGFPRTETPAPAPQVPAAQKPAALRNAYQVAMDAARRHNETQPDPSKHITPAMALSSGLAKFTPPKEEVAPEPEAVVPNAGVTWAVPVDSADYEDGITLEPVSSLEGIRSLGAELENQYFFKHKAEEGARACKTGNYLVAAVMLNGSPMGMAEYTVQNGSVTLASLTAYAQEVISGGQYARAAVTFARDLTVGSVFGQTLFPTGSGFSAEQGQDFELTTQKATIPYSQPLFRNLGSSPSEDSPLGDFFKSAFGQGSGVNGGYDTAETEKPASDEQASNEAKDSWDPLVEEDYHASNGLIVSIVTNLEDLREMGITMNNPLSNEQVAMRYAGMAREGLAQHYTVTRGDGVMVGCGCLLPVEGQVSVIGKLDGHPVKPYGRGNSDPAASVNIAVSEFASNVNRDDIEVAIEIDGDRFEQVTFKFGNGYGA